MEPLLKIRDLHAGYGPIKALRGIDLEVHPGEVFALIGSNGAGKTTLLMTICGIVQPERGQVFFGGEDITARMPYYIMRNGIAQVPEGRRIFPQMTLLENLQMGAAGVERSEVERRLERVMKLFPILEERQRQSGGTLSGGEQQMLAIARAIMGQPRLMLMDEPSLGLAPLIVKQIFEIIREINAAGTTILLVEQNAYAALQLAQRACVLATGEIVAQGTSQELMKNPDVQRAYLGG